MSIPGISSGNPFQQWQSPPAANEHVMAPGETLQSVAKDYGISAQALYDANPQIHPPVLLQAGMRLAIPEAGNGGGGGGNAAPVNASGTATEKNETSQTDTDGTKTTSETHQSTKVGVDPDAGTVSLSTGTGFSKDVTNAKGRGVSFGVDANASTTAGKKTENGTTTYTVSGDVSVSLKAGVHSKQAGLEVGHTEGIKSSWEVAMPEATANGTDLASVNPFDPDSMPTGTSVKIDGSHYSTNEFQATFKNLANKYTHTEASGTSVAVEKTDDHTVRVTAGPTEAIDAYNGVGVDFGVASAMLGRADHLGNATLQSAEFDLSTEAGRAAYNDFLAGGNLPEDNGEGIANVKTIEKLDYSSQAKFDAKLGPVSIGVNGAKNTGSSVVVTEPDGSMTRTVNLQYGDNVPMTMSQKFDADGNEIADARTYSYTIKADDNTSQLINAAQTGSVENAKDGPVKPGQTVTITYTQEEMGQLESYVQKAIDASQGTDFKLKALAQDYDGKPISTQDFAVALARNLGGNDYGAAERLFHISQAGDGNIADRDMVALPGKISVTG